MDIAILKKAGLTESQAKGYLALIEYGTLTPTELAEKTGESRTNAYMVADKLVDLGLATKSNSKKAVYTPNHPTALEALVERRRKIVTRNEQEVRQSISPLIDLFYASTEMPGTRTVEGLEGIKQVYEETLKCKDKAIYLLRTTADTPTLGDTYFEHYRKQRAEAGIDTYALTPMTDISHQHARSGDDRAMRYHRTPLPDNAYTAPVEIDVYDNKTILIAFGETQMATIITSPPIAKAMRQILTLLRQQYASDDI